MRHPRPTPPQEAFYRGIIKHKRWRPRGGFGTLCPSWTHHVAGQGFADPHAYPWLSTPAHTLFTKSLLASDGHRYAASRGIAFIARSSNDGTWHGHPLPWNDVPGDVQDRLIEAGQARRADIRRQNAIRPGDIEWALTTDGD